MTVQTQQAKVQAARYAASLVQSGVVVGLGSGSTAELVVRALGARVRSGLEIVTVATSRRTARLARRLGLTVLEPDLVDRIDIAIDGADEVEERSLGLLKGRGGALVREKLVARMAQTVVIVVDDTKLVSRLGVRHPVPVEVVPFGWRWCARWLEQLGGRPILRCREDGRPYRSDNGNVILDVWFESIEDPNALAEAVKQLPGVVDHGLFLDLADLVVVGTAEDVRVLTAEPKRQRSVAACG